MANDYNIGRDVSLDIVDPILGVLQLAIKTGWTAEPQYDDVNSKALDGQPRHEAIPNGHRLTMELDRRDASIDNFFALREAAYFNGQEVPLATITETVRERGGGITVFRYTGVSLRQEANTWRGNTPTTARLTGMARRKIKVT